MRVRIPSLKGNEDLARPLREHLASIPGVARVEVNPVTGSVLVVHHAREATAPELVQSLAEGLAPLVGVDQRRLQAHLSHDARPRRSHQGGHGFLKDLNASFKWAPSGADMSHLDPAH